MSDRMANERNLPARNYLAYQRNGTGPQVLPRGCTVRGNPAFWVSIIDRPLHSARLPSDRNRSSRSWPDFVLGFLEFRFCE